MLKTFVSVVSALAFASGSADAALFSFASDRNADGPTFSGLGFNAITDGRPQDTDGVVNTTFLVDRDEDGPNPAQSIPATFEYNAVVTNYQVVPFGGQFVHQFTLDGSFSVLDAGTGAPLLVVNFDNAFLSSWSNSQVVLGRSAQMQNNGDADRGLTFSTAGSLADIEVSQLCSFGFSLSNVRLQNGNRVPVVAGILGTPWQAEASFSGSAIPAPGACALAAVSALIIGRRRRD